MTNKKKSIVTLVSVVLAIVLAVPAAAAETPTIRVSSYKGNTLEVGKRSVLIIGPSGTEYTVTSSAPDVVAVEQVLTFWVAVAKEEGNAEITVSNSAGDRGSVTLTVGPAIPRQRRQRRPNGQPGDTPGDNQAHQPDPKGQWGARTAGQRSPDERRPSLLQPALHLASLPRRKQGRCRRWLPLWLWR